MFKKSKRSFRQRIQRHSDSDEDEENSRTIDDHNNDDSSTFTGLKISSSKTSSNDPDSNDDNSNLSIKLSNNNQKTERKTKLSFEDDEEEDVFIVKKSLYSRRMEKNKQKLLKSKNNTKSPIHINSNPPNEDIVQKQMTLTNEVIKNADSTIVTDPKDDKIDNEVIVCPASEDDEDCEDFHQSKNLDQMKGPQFRTALERGVIPDAKTIYELKKQRQKLARTVNEDFIPLDNEENETSTGNVPSSRLVHESDEDKSEDGNDLHNLDDDDEDNLNKEWIQFGNIDYQTKEKEKLKERFRVSQEQKNEESNSRGKKYSEDDYDDNDHVESSDDDNDENKYDDYTSKDESEDEMDKWEREQIRKAVRLPNIYSYTKSEINNKFLSGDDNITLINKLQVIHDNHNVVAIEVDQPEAKTFRCYMPPYISDRSTKQEIILDQFDDRIQTAKQQLEKSMEENRQFYDRVCMELKLASEDVESYQSDMEKLTNDYNFYRNMLDFVRNLCDCINDKLAELEKNERQVLEVFRNHTRRKLQRHQNDIQDQNTISLYFIMNHKALCLQYGQMKQLNSILDVYNFDDDEEKQKRSYLREERFKNKKYSQEFDNHDDTDDEKENAEDFKDYQEELRKIKVKVDELFEDTDDDFASIKGIIQKFKHWKDDRIETYRESFITEFLPKFLTFYLRYDLILWNVFDKNSKLNLMEMEGIQNLILYVTSSNNSTTADFNLIDLDVIPALIENTIIPKLINIIEQEIWNPLSTRQTNRLVTFLNLLSSNFPTLLDSSENLPQLLQKIVLRLEKTIENDIFIPQMIPADFFVPLSNGLNSQRSQYENLVISYVVRFFDHQYWQTFRMMSNVIAFRNLIDDQIIRELALDKICSRYLLMSIQRSSADSEKTFIRINRLISNIPKEWINNRQNPNIQNNFNILLQQLLDRSNSGSSCGSYTEEIRQKLLTLKYQINR